MTADKKIEGEGSREAAQHYNESTREFVKSGKVEEKAREAAKTSNAADQQAEKEGKKHIKEEDPAIERDYSKPEKPD